MSGFPLAFQDILGTKPSRGDVATVLIAAPIGFVADGFLTISGLPSPGVASLSAASVALGIKRAVQPEGMSRRRALRAARRLKIILAALGEKAKSDRDKEILDKLLNRLDTELKMCEKRVTSSGTLAVKIDQTHQQLATLDMHRLSE